MLGWTNRVHCKPCCETSNWDVKNGVWTCFHCGTPMTTADVARYHKTLCSCPPKDRSVVGYTCQTCRKPIT